MRLFTGASLVEDFPVTPEDALIIDSLARFHPSMPELPQAANGIPLEAASREPTALSRRRRKAPPRERSSISSLIYNHKIHDIVYKYRFKADCGTLKITTITIDDRPGKPDRITEKIRSVERRLGKEVRK
jgi:hypothetical protein